MLNAVRVDVSDRGCRVVMVFDVNVRERRLEQPPAEGRDAHGCLNETHQFPHHSNMRRFCRKRARAFVVDAAPMMESNDDKLPNVKNSLLLPFLFIYLGTSSFLSAQTPKGGPALRSVSKA